MNELFTTKATLIAAICLCSMSTSCKKFLDVGAPTTSINAENVYQNDNTASAVLTGIYSQAGLEFNGVGITSISLRAELSADNLIFYNPNSQNYTNYWQNSLTANYNQTENYFTGLYPKIYTINSAIEGLNASSSVTPIIKQRLLGEAYFLRAFLYFYLVNFFGDVPLILTTDYQKNAISSRISSADVYHQIEEDLKKSESLLDNEYLDASITKTTQERLRPNKGAAIALLARVQLYRREFQQAIESATKVINQTTQYRLTGLDSVFKKNSLETIWALQPVKTGFNTDEAAVFLLNSVPGPTYKPLSLSQSLIQSFESNDKRKTSWTGTFSTSSTDYHFAAKYKADANSTSVTEYCIVLRLSEQYLIRSEAHLELNNVQESLNNLNTIRNRAGLPSIHSASTPILKKALLQERRVELFTEWGHRWLDLKRSNTIDNAMNIAMQYKGGSWSSFKSLYPIPNAEILRNKNLTQNNGY